MNIFCELARLFAIQLHPLENLALLNAVFGPLYLDPSDIWIGIGLSVVSSRGSDPVDFTAKRIKSSFTLRGLMSEELEVLQAV